MTSFKPILVILSPLLLQSLAGCDQIAVLDGSKARDADAFAVGSACRQSGRALEDCFVMYTDSPKAQVFAGWKEMNDYMTQNKIEVVVPTLVKAEIKPEARPEDSEEKAEKPELKTGKVSGLPPTSTAAADPMAGIGKLRPAPQNAGAENATAGGAPKPGAARGAKH